MEQKRLEALRQGLEHAIRELPTGFYDTFDFVKGTKNLCHPITVGLIAKVLGEMEDIDYVGFDVRLNDGNGHKFQPDVVGFRGVENVRDNQPTIFVDFESPNSCDARIPRYHLRQYLQWAKDLDPKPPYVIVTSLPNASSPKWKLLYASGRLQSWHKGNLEEIRANPFRYWTNVWDKDLRGHSDDLSEIFFLNIDGRKVVSFQVLQPK
ncbi:MAG: hypothetical protein ABSD31_05925 [Candidatus Binataceae bacterium]|jgi:hypothetical protein